jgi:hypothetical protein
MSPVLPALAAVALSGLHDIKGTIPPPGLPPFAASALIALAAAGAGAFAAARRKRVRQDPESPDQVKPVERLLKLRDAYCGGMIPQATLFDQLWEELRCIGPAGQGSLASDQAVPAAGDLVPEIALPLLRSLVMTCDAVRYGNETLENDRVVKALDDAVAVVTTWGRRSL